MSALANRQRACDGLEIDRYAPQFASRLPSSGINHINARCNGCYADHP